jgi:hypothetical protein
MSSLIDVKEVCEKIQADGYFIFKNAYTVQLAETVRNEYFNSMGDVEMTYTGFTYKQLLDGPIRKKNISSSNGLGEAYAQVLQTTYYPKQNKFPAISEMYKLLVELRNKMTGMPLDYGDNPEKDRFWNAVRIHHYPKGGGFMAMHRDTHFSKFVGVGNFVQILFLLTKKGADFIAGGGRINDLNGNLIDIEETGGFGSVVFFDGRIPHGVFDVDPAEPFSFDKKNGRLAAVMNAYEYRE